MGCRVEVKAPKPRTGVRLTRLYGIGEEGRGGAYATRLGAKKASQRISPRVSGQRWVRNQHRQNTRLLEVVIRVGGHSLVVLGQSSVFLSIL